ncbi:MAG: hypothetical protein RLZZ618_4302 [Pseudomonadota bacterium]|jgi:ABC-type branched-subunit amino acid transport system substrate-binding protein
MTSSIQRRTLLAAAAAAAGASLSTSLRAQPAGSSEIVIGQSLPLTGPVAAVLTPIVEGQALAIDSVNRKGGINGRKVRLVQLDDAFDPRRTAENVATLIERDKVVALTGLASTPGVAAVMPMLLEKKVPLFGVYTGSHLLRARPHPYFFTTTASYADEVAECVRHLVTLQRGRIAVAFQNNEFGKLMLPIAEAAIKERGATLVASVPVAVDASDALAAAMTVNAKQPQAVLLLSIAGPSVVGFVKAYKAVGAAPIYTISTALGALPALGDDARGIAVTQIVPYWRQTDPLAREYMADATRARQTPNYAHYGAYLMFRMLFDGIRRAGNNVTPQTVTKGIESIRGLKVATGDISFSTANHHPGRFVEITIVGPRGVFIR